MLLARERHTVRLPNLKFAEIRFAVIEQKTAQAFLRLLETAGALVRVIFGGNSLGDHGCVQASQLRHAQVCYS